MKKDVSNNALKTWVDLNLFLLSANSQSCASLMEEEKAGRNRPQFIKRIHSRLNKARADEEREKLGIA